MGTNKTTSLTLATSSTIVLRPVGWSCPKITGRSGSRQVRE